MPAPRKRSWDFTLRDLIKTRHGPGWAIRGHRGKVQLTRWHDDHTRSSVSLDLPWDASCQTEVVKVLEEIHQRMEGQGLGLAEAYALIRHAPTEDGGRLDWERVVESFTASRKGRRQTTLGDLRTRMGRTLEVLRAKPSPKDGRALLRAYAARHFDEKCPVGGVGRKRQLLDVAALLRFAVTRAGAA